MPRKKNSFLFLLTCHQVDVQRATRQALHCTPSRFARVSQNRTWNTGNGSPDAICFSVDRPGVLVAGACIYGGVGNEWHYELELLDDVSARETDARCIVGLAPTRRA